MFVEISSRKNEQLKYLHKLGNKSFRDQENCFFIEGTKLFLEALSHDLKFRQLFLTEQWLESQDLHIKEAITDLADQDITVAIVEAALFNGISTMQQPEGIIGILKKMKVQPQVYRSYVLLEDVQDPYNVGTIIRTADAAGIECIITSPKTADIYNEKVLRGSMGSVFHVPIFQVDSLIEMALNLKNKQVQLIGTSLDGMSLWERQPISEPYAIIMGNESRGMSAEMSQLCDVLLKIPIPGKAESLNVSTAAGIVIYDIIRDFKIE